MASTPESLYDQTLVIRSRLGDEAAFEELVRRHNPMLLGFARRMLQSAPETLPDVMQDVWVAIYRSLPRLCDAGKFRSWAFRIARDRIYREYRRGSLLIEDAQFDEMPDTVDGHSHLDREAVQQCLQLLPPPQREALILRFFDEMSYEEIATITGSTVGTVRSRIHYGKAAMKQAWKETSYE